MDESYSLSHLLRFLVSAGKGTNNEGKETRGRSRRVLFKEALKSCRNYFQFLAVSKAGIHTHRLNIRVQGMASQRGVAQAPKYSTRLFLFLFFLAREELN